MIQTTKTAAIPFQELWTQAVNAGRKIQSYINEKKKKKKNNKKKRIWKAPPEKKIDKNFVRQKKKV